MSVQAAAQLPAPHSTRPFITGRYGYLLLAAVVAVLLIVGDGAKPVTPDAARIAHLESIIRCPSCADLSIADSEAQSAVGLRTEVTKDVDEGMSDQAIEAQVEHQFVGTLLVPSGGDGVALFLIPAAIIVAGAVTFAMVILRRSRREVSGDELADQAIVDAARRAREAGQ